MMNNLRKNEYLSIDRFRLVAALLVVAIHTSPLTDVNGTADFILTRVLGRLAVPFFFMTSAFFLYHQTEAVPFQRLLRFIKKTALLYAGAILFYLPVNLYNGKISQWTSFPELIKDILFDGTIYHLWYLPASILGASLSWWLLRRLSFGQAFAVSMLLYLVGLFGDSYYGIAVKVSLLETFYQQLFHFFDYTRNGLFFTPIFFVMGSHLAKKSKIMPARNHIMMSARKAFSCFTAAFSLMLAEGLILHSLKLQRHDSMYLMLLPCMYLLFQGLLAMKGAKMQPNQITGRTTMQPGQISGRTTMQPGLISGRTTIPPSQISRRATMQPIRVSGRASLRIISTITYLIHPAVIVLIRGFAKSIDAQKLLVDNSILFFLEVAVLSLAMSLIVSVILRKWQHRKTPATISGAGCTHRAWAEITLPNLIHNAKVLKSLLPQDCQIMPVVKANAYGHGLKEVAYYCNKAGIKAFAVATAEEGITLRRAGIKGEILILGFTPAERARELLRWRLTQTAVDASHGMELNQSLSFPHRLLFGRRLKVHIKLDTGMHRLGEDDNNLSEIAKIFDMENLKVTGIYTHLCASDSLEKDSADFTEHQIIRFYEVIDRLKEQGYQPPCTHILSSYGTINHAGSPYFNTENMQSSATSMDSFENRKSPCSFARVGIALYGVLSTAPDSENKNLPALKPVLALKARVSLVRTVSPKESVGYGLDFKVQKETKVAVVTIGYADGYPRNLSGKGCALIHGVRVPVIGRICMDQLLIDVSEIGQVARGDIVTLIGKDGHEEITAEEVAANSGTITNELLSRLGSRLSRVYCS